MEKESRELAWVLLRQGQGYPDLKQTNWESNTRAEKEATCARVEDPRSQKAQDW